MLPGTFSPVNMWPAPWRKAGRGEVRCLASLMVL